MRHRIPASIATIAGLLIPALGCGGSDLADPGRLGGSVTVATSTTGPTPDPDGYSVTLDGSPTVPVSTNARLILDDIAPGEHQVALDGLAPGCVVGGENPRPVQIQAGEAKEVLFLVTCSAATLEIATSTTGPGPFAPNYTVSVDGGGGRPIGINGTLDISDLVAGDHLVALSGLTSNCALSGANPRTVTVTPPDTAELRFEIACTTPAGTIRVTTSTSGAAPDPDGYAVSLDGGPPQPIGVNGSLDFVGVLDGPHKVLLSGLAAFCVSAGDDPREVQVSGARASLDFEISCPGPFSSGVILYAGEVGSATHLFIMPPDGSNAIDLTPNASAYNGRWSPDGTKIAFQSYRNETDEIFVMNADGSHLVRLADGGEPAWSPDGSRIVFVRGSDLYLMRADGADVRLLTAATRAAAPSWSPDGSTIAYSSLNPGACTLLPNWDVLCAEDIYTVTSTGSSPRQLTHATTPHSASNSPVWSPDGSTIAFWRASEAFRVTDGDLYLMAADGSGQVALATTADVTEAFPVWSPDGGTIAFATAPAGKFDFDIALVSRQGGQPVTIRSSPGQQVPNSWK